MLKNEREKRGLFFVFVFDFFLRQHHLNNSFKVYNGLTYHTISSDFSERYFLIRKYVSVCVWVGVHVGTSVIQVTATDADDANYGNSAKVVYSILQGQPYFSVDPESGNNIYYLILSQLCNASGCTINL